MQVPLQIVFRNLGPSAAIATRIKQRAAWLERHCRQIISCRVAVEAPHKHHRRGNLYQIRINLRVPGEELVVRRAPALHKAYKDMMVTIHDAFDDARRELEEYARRRRREIKAPAQPPQGRVIRLLRGDGGYGFLRTEDGRELYFHSHSVLNDGFDRLEVGSQVRYVEEAGEDGPQASTVELLRTRARRAAEA